MHTPKKVLLVDSAFSAIPIYQALCKSGFDVWTIGNRESDALALISAERWIKQDYSDVAQVQAIVEEQAFDYIVPGCTDLSIEVCQQLRGYRNFFDSEEVYANLGNKKAFRNLCQQMGLYSPVEMKLADFPRAGCFIVKPVDSYSGQGISIVDGNNLQVLSTVVEQAEQVSRSGHYIIESYIEGQLYSFSALLTSHKVVESFIVKEGSSTNPYAVDTSYIDEGFPEEVKAYLTVAMAKLSAHLQLKDGLIHLQFILRDNCAYLIEITRRCPGDLYSLLIEYSTGIPYSQLYAAYFTETKMDNLCSPRESNHIVRHTVSADKNLPFTGLELSHPISCKAIFPLSSLGEPLAIMQQKRVAIIFAEATDEQQKIALYDNFIDRSRYQVTAK
ncbi:ATP-grasp domain-containing protein [Shewanella psychropiezotolerans]|uniref:ATP-grasp domain-containing protein n=1 Tax=Shewanella psychropiezotolerans TaxID=2593655 RepID=A0ABX5WWF1_9GAMM|nr:ATP-grasp domain-containing protein [Shewanella psychropiezotolerans]QDO83430.1 ATP-grasp domain-containing protein [Shewanella psychropiezotolerans]